MTKTAFLEELERTVGIEKLVRVVARLRDPVNGCPWDLKQTHQSLKPYMLEEAYEAVEAVDEAAASGNSDVLKEELGDVLLQVVLHAQLAQDARTFDFQAICETIAEKLIRRHPHVFGEVAVEGAEDVVVNWEAIKQAEKGGEKPKSVLDGVSKAQPALSRALDTSKKAVKVGFEWPSFESLWDCVMSEYREFRDEAELVLPSNSTLDAEEAVADAKTAMGTGIPQNQVSPDPVKAEILKPSAEISSALFERLELEMGDILFATVNLARHFKIDPEAALTRATDKFTRRFQTMETLIQERHGQDKDLNTLTFQEWDDLWNEAKTRCGH